MPAAVGAQGLRTSITRVTPSAREERLISLPPENAPQARFRHVVFRGQRGGRAVNLAPQPVESAPQANPGEADFPTDQAAFVYWLFARAGLNARAYRAETLRRRVPACFRALRVSCAMQARLNLEREPGLCAAAIGAMLIGVSGFFRDAAACDRPPPTAPSRSPRRPRPPPACYRRASGAR